MNVSVVLFFLFTAHFKLYVYFCEEKKFVSLNAWAVLVCSVVQLFICSDFCSLLQLVQQFTKY